jgi:hypothetical protein
MSHARACPTAVRLRKGGVFSLENFTFDDKRDINVCRAREVLTTIELFDARSHFTRETTNLPGRKSRFVTATAIH